MSRPWTLFGIGGLFLDIVYDEPATHRWGLQRRAGVGVAPVLRSTANRLRAILPILKMWAAGVRLARLSAARSSRKLWVIPPGCTWILLAQRGRVSIGRIFLKAPLALAYVSR